MHMAACRWSHRRGEAQRRELTVKFAARVHGRGDDRHVLHHGQRAGAPHLAQHPDSRPHDAALAAAGQGRESCQAAAPCRPNVRCAVRVLHIVRRGGLDVLHHTHQAARNGAMAESLRLAPTGCVRKTVVPAFAADTPAQRPSMHDVHTCREMNG
jgi:hypothetical protein